MSSIQKTFGSYVDKKKRDAIKELKLIERLLKVQGMKVDDFLENRDGDDSYIFCYNPMKNADFDGIRIYKIADEIAFRIQKENKTHPYGRAYAIPVEDMFNDFLEEEDTSEEKAGKKVMESVVKEVRRFFEKSYKIEKDDRMASIDGEAGEGSGNVDIRPQVTDFSNMIFNKT